MPEKTFVLGVGAQKAGTTWLHRYLSSYDCVKTGFSKEYHIWDAIHTPECRRFRVSAARALISRKAWARRRMQLAAEHYFAYFDRLLRDPKTTVTADITPSYASLSSSVFGEIVEGFAERDIRVKVVFLMRDPVERCWSAVRMHRKKGRALENVLIDVDEGRALLEYCKSSDALLRTQYDDTVREIEKAVPRADVFYGFFEDLFEPASIDELSSFLGLQPKHDFARRTFNATEKKISIERNVLRSVANQYASVYEFCENRFPRTKDLWLGFQLI